MTVNTEQRLATIRKQVRASGRRWTVAKSAIVSALLDGGGHLSARRILEAVHQRYPEIDQSTVYRVLQTLTDENVIHALDQRGEARFGLADDPHHHAICVDCGRDTEIPDHDVRGLLAAAEATTGFRFDGQTLSLAGRCAACAAAPKPAGDLDAAGP